MSVSFYNETSHSVCNLQKYYKNEIHHVHLSMDYFIIVVKDELYSVLAYIYTYIYIIYKLYNT